MFVLFFIQNSKTHIIECAYFAFVRTGFKIYADLLYHGFTIRKRVKLFIYFTPYIDESFSSFLYLYVRRNNKLRDKRVIPIL